MNTIRSRRSSVVAFTLVELLTVIAIIAILMGLLIPGIIIAREMVRRAQAKTAEAGIIGATDHYYTDYGKYPLGSKTPDPSTPADVMFGDGTTSNQALFDILRNIGPSPGVANDYNPKGVVYMQTMLASDPIHPQAGFAPQDAGAVKKGAYVDPWGNEYRIAIDANMDNTITNLPYLDFQSAKSPTVGVAVFSLGKDGTVGNKGDNLFMNGSNKSDDIVSWQ